MQIGVMGLKECLQVQQQHNWLDVGIWVLWDQSQFFPTRVHSDNVLLGWDVRKVPCEDNQVVSQSHCSTDVRSGMRTSWSLSAKSVSEGSNWGRNEEPRRFGWLLMCRQVVAGDFNTLVYMQRIFTRRRPLLMFFFFLEMPSLKSAIISHLPTVVNSPENILVTGQRTDLLVQSCF